MELLTKLPNYKNKEVFIVATGESLKDFEFKLLEGKNVIAVCKAYQYVEHDFIVSLDWKSVALLKNKNIISHFNIKLDPKAKPDTLDYILAYGNNSGLTALAIALQLNARKINLLGFDVGWKKQRYFYGHEEKKGHDYTRHLPCFDYFKVNKNIINWSKDSLIECFEKRDIEELQEKLKYEKIWNNYNYKSSNQEVLLETILYLIKYFKWNYKTFLEIGTGNGWVINQLRKSEYQAFGTDITLTGLLNGSTNDIFLQDNIWSSKLYNNFAHISFSCDVLEHIPTKFIEQTFKEIDRITYHKSFHFISTMSGALYCGYPVHLTHKPMDWWRQFETNKIKLFSIDELNSKTAILP